MKSSRLWPWVIAGIVIVLVGAFTMATEIGSAQWVIGLVIVVVGVALLVRTGVGARRR